MNHSIRTQYLHVAFNGSEDAARTLHGRLSEWCRSELLPVLADALDRCVPDDAYWIVDRLDVDAGSIASDRWQKDLTLLIGKALENALKQRLPLGPIYPLQGQALQTAGDRDDLVRQSAPERLTSAWLHFLVTGALPWPVKMLPGQSLEDELLAAWQQHPPSSTLPFLLSSALADDRVKMRLALQFSQVFLIELLRRAAPAMQDEMAAIERSFADAGLAEGAAKAFYVELLKTALEAGHRSPAENVEQALRQMAASDAQEGSLSGLLERYAPKGAGFPDSPAKNADRIAVRVKKPPDNRQPASNHSGHPLRQPALTKDSIGTSEDGIYIDNAGLVILHPFLPQLFTALAIAEEDRLIQPERALCLLHFLTTGQTPAPEYELILPKVLCNVPLSLPVPADVDLSDSEREEAEALLTAVIRHWTALKNTGFDGLRSTFLQRSGKIGRRSDGDWFMQVETMGFDVLLDSLPWGLSAVKLPWMNSILWVEWSI